VSPEPTVLELQDTLYNSKNPTRRWIHTRRRETIEELLADVGGGGVGRALEVGPGSGIYLPTLADLADEVVATDVEPAFLERARQLVGDRPGVRFLGDDIIRTRLEPASFDLILCTEVIEHIDAWAAAVASMARLLRPGGALVLSTPQPWSPLELLGRIAFRPGVIRLVRAIYREPILPTGHISLVSSRRLGRQLTASGLRAERRMWTGVYLPVVAELGGAVALRAERALEPVLQARPLRGLLWTQYVVARR
jgi:SAM-dependent methyltransferase